MQPTAQKLHLARVDVLRAIAILLVFSAHFEGMVRGAWLPHWQGMWAVADRKLNFVEAVLNVTVFSGVQGVYLFFIISGLCIRLSQRNSAQFAIGAFYWRRFWRIYPPYLLIFLTLVAIQHINILHPPGSMDFLTHLFLVHNLSPDYRMSISVPFWSLGAEAQLYLLYPVLLWSWDRLGKQKTLAILLFLAIVPDFIGGNEFRHRFHLPDAFQALADLPTKLWFTWTLGFMIADQLYDRKPPFPIGWPVILLLLFGGCLSFYFKPLVHFGVPLSGAGLALLVSKYLNVPAAQSWSPTWLAALGLCSYSFYLYFDSLLRPLLSFLKDTLQIQNQALLFFGGYCLCLAVIWAASYLLWRFVELPSIALGRRLWSSARRNPTTPTSNPAS
jgi:peptidoglycan/LPS O-acetylase OafA/YrhL